MTRGRAGTETPASVFSKLLKATILDDKVERYRLVKDLLNEHKDKPYHSDLLAKARTQLALKANEFNV